MLRTDSGLLHNSTPGGGDTAAEKADLVEGGLGVNGHDRDVRNDGVL